MNWTNSLSDKPINQSVNPVDKWWAARLLRTTKDYINKAGQKIPAGKIVRVIKRHGSITWMRFTVAYKCENCNTTVHVSKRKWEHFAILSNDEMKEVRYAEAKELVNPPEPTTVGMTENEMEIQRFAELLSKGSGVHIGPFLDKMHMLVINDITIEGTGHARITMMAYLHNPVQNRSSTGQVIFGPQSI